MNPDEILMSRCLHGEASTADWHRLDQLLTRDPLAARRWCEAARIDAELTRLLEPWRVPKSGILRKAAGLGAAAMLAAGGFAAWQMPPTDVPGAETRVEWLSGETGRYGSTDGPDGSLPARQPEPGGAVALDASPVPAGPDSGPPAPPALPGKFSRVITKEKVMALTFDDGPHAEYTPRLLAILKAEGVKATFFPVGTSMKHYPLLLKQTVADGHELGNHTWTHPALGRLPNEKVREEVEKCRGKLREFTGRDPDLFRPPYGSITPAQDEFSARDFGCSTVLWSVDSLDWKSRKAETVTETVIGQAGPGRIVLLHEIHRATVEAVPSIIQRLKADGWKFVTVTELSKLGPKAQGASVIPEKPVVLPAGVPSRKP